MKKTFNSYAIDKTFRGDMNHILRWQVSKVGSKDRKRKAI